MCSSQTYNFTRCVRWTLFRHWLVWNSVNTMLKPKRHSLRCHGFVVHALLLRMHTNVVDFRVMRRLCHREWNWLWNWRCVNQHSWDPWQRTTWSRRVTSDFNSVLEQWVRWILKKFGSVSSVESHKGAINYYSQRCSVGNKKDAIDVQSLWGLASAIAPFWFSTEHIWIVIAPFWLSTDGFISSFWRIPWSRWL